MKKRRLSLIILSCILAFTMLFTACGTKSTDNTGSTGTDNSKTTAADENADPFGKYSTPIELTASRVLATWMGFDEGENENNNWWSKTYLDQLGIKLNVVWTAPFWGEPLEQKINTSLATDDLPDIVPVYSSYAYKIAKAGKAADITEAFNKYASPLVKKNMEIGGGLAYKASTYDGKMFALPSTSVYGNSFKQVWIRADWLKKVNLPVPKTLQDIEAVAKAFVDNKLGGNNTIGITADKDLRDSEGIFEMFNGHRTGWIKKGEELVYAPIQPEIKDGLKLMAKWYKDGLMAKDFAAKDADNEEKADIAGSKVGVVFGGDHSPNSGAFRDAKKNSPDSDWVWVALPAQDGSEFVKQLRPSKIGDFTVVTSKCKNPEAVVKMVNLATQVFSSEKPAFVTNEEYNTTKGGNMGWWNAVVTQVTDPAQAWRDWQVSREAIKNGSDSTLKTFDQKTYYGQLKTWKDEGTKAKDFDLLWSLQKLFDYGGSVEWSETNADKVSMWDEQWGPDTDAQVKNGGDWNSKHKEYWIRAIMTGDVDKEFDDWVNYWKLNGGDDATKEVNDWYKASK